MYQEVQLMHHFGDTASQRPHMWPIASYCWRALKMHYF